MYRPKHRLWVRIVPGNYSQIYANVIVEGIPITSVMYLGLTRQQNSKIQIPMVIYQGLQLVISSLLTIAHRRWVRQEEEEEAARKALEKDDAKV